MIIHRRSADRGHFNHGWLDTRHTFSFAGYRDPTHMGFRALRVINEDVVQPGQGFGMHAHADMEIITYVLSGVLEHRDSLGNGEVLRAGEVQRMTAGRGIEHSEFNPSDVEPVHLYQIWLRPAARGLDPSYDQKVFAPEGRAGKWQLLASPDGRDGSLTICQDADVWLATLAPGGTLAFPLRPARHAWIQVTRGEVSLQQSQLTAGDGAAVSEESTVALSSASGSEVLLFDLA